MDERESRQEARVGGGSRWPRRRVLRWALGLLPVAAAGGWAARGWLGARGRVMEGSGAEGNAARVTRLLQETALYCFVGHPSAGPRLYWVLKDDDSHGPARLMSACWFMQQGLWDLAREDLASPAVRETPEAHLLRELAERRRGKLSWRHAFFDSWQALGRPDLRDSPLLPEPLQFNHVLGNIEGVWGASDEPGDLPLGGLNPALLGERPVWVLTQVRDSSSVPLLMALREQLEVLEAQAPVRQLLLPGVEERLGQLAGSSPRTLQLALLALLAGSLPTAPLARRELEALEEYLVLSEWRQPSDERFFLEMRALFEPLLLAPGHHALLLATSALGLSLGERLLLRARASRAHLGEDEQRWMGRLLWETGARLREQRSHPAMDLGLRLQLFGSELTGHSPTRMECIAAWVELGQWEDALRQAAFFRWPLASLQEESCEPRARDEVVWMRAFAGKGALP